MRSSGLLTVGAAVLVTGALGGCAGPDLAEPFASAEARATVAVGSVPAPADAQEVTVARVVDGDTLVVSGDAGTVLPEAGEHRVRLLLVDTPEVDGPNASQECLGPESSDFTTGLLPAGSTVLLAADEEPLDSYDRLLAYAWTTDGVFVNEALTANGFAYSVVLPPNDEHLGVVVDGEQRARDARLGVWGSC